MTTVNSLSGGQTSSYIAANYPADYNVFALVRTSDINCLYPDEKVRQIISDKIGTEFIGTLEDDMIINTILDLEQYIGQKIDWVTGKTFDEIINRNGKRYLPNVTQRFCTSEMKLVPIYKWWKNSFSEPVEMRIGYRANETNRAANSIIKQSVNGFTTFKDVVGYSKNGRKKWREIEWQKQIYPLITDGIYKDNIVEFWKDKPVRFAYMNNCIGCFHRNEVLLNFMSKLHPEKFDWFARQEMNTGYATRTFRNGITYDKIRRYEFTQQSLSFDDFTDCDSGYCGL
jgi:hypothetical protein